MHSLAGSVVGSVDGAVPYIRNRLLAWHEIAWDGWDGMGCKGESFITSPIEKAKRKGRTDE